MFDTAIIVLLYNKEIAQSTTLSSLMLEEAHFKNAKLVIWNNGPKKLESYDVSFIAELGYDITIEETLNNESLAYIYNSFINSHEAEKYIFLDDDSTLNANYIDEASRSNSSVVSMPIITVNGVAKNPKINSKVYTEGVKIAANDKVFTIGSGLVVGREVILELLKRFYTVFDERFYLYGVDTTFCHRLFLSKQSVNIRVIAGFEHSLSRLEKECKSLTKFRQRERSYDRGMTLRYYTSFPRTVYILVHSVLYTIKCIFLNKDSSMSLPLLLKSYIVGKHYRDID